MVIETAVLRNALRDFGHTALYLCSIALNSLMRGSYQESAEVLTNISRRPFVACQPNLHNILVLAQGIEP